MPVACCKGFGDNLLMPRTLCSICKKSARYPNVTKHVTHYEFMWSSF